MQKIVLEYAFKTNVSVLFKRVSTASGLAEWFADSVNSTDSEFSFLWEGSEETAEQVCSVKNDLVRYRWLDREEEDCFLEFKIVKDDITGDVALLVTDCVDDDEVEEATDLWDQQISTLKAFIGG